MRQATEDDVGTGIVDFGDETEVGVADEAVVDFGYGSSGVDVGLDPDYFDIGMVDEEAYEFAGAIGVGGNDGGFNHVWSWGWRGVRFFDIARETVR